MATASLDTVGFCASPAQKANRGASDLLEGQLFAYGCGSGVVVVEVQQLQVAATLESVVHKAGVVTSVKWCPTCHSRDLVSDTHLRLASGDSNGDVAVWDVQTQSVCAALDDALLVAGSNAPKLGAVAGMEWVTAKPFQLAILMAPATVLVWDTQGDAILWQHDLSSSSVPEPFASMTMDPLDHRRLCLSGPGHLALVTLSDLAASDVAVKHFKLESRGAGSKADNLRGSAGVSVASTTVGMQAVFSSTRGLLFVLLPREIQVLDMELGVPAASRMLPGGRAPFVALLGVYGRGVSHGGGDEGGSDCCYALHADGSLTIWLRTPGELRYTLSCACRLMPPVSRNAAQSLALLAVRAQVWKHDVAVDELVRRPWLGSTEEVTHKLQSLLLPDSAAETAPGSDREGGSAFARTENTAKSQAAAPKATRPVATGANTSSKSLLIMAVTSDGKVWQWDAPLPRFSDRSFIASVVDTPLVSVSGSMQSSSQLPPPPAAAPILVGMLHTLPHAVTTLNMFPKLVATGRRFSIPAPHAQRSSHLASHPQPSPHLPPKPQTSTAGGVPGNSTAAAATEAPRASNKPGGGEGGRQFSGGDVAEAVEVALMGAAVTAAGNVELFTMTRGQASPLAAEVALSLNVHRNAVVRGVRWLGATARLVSFTVERVQISAQQAGAALAAQEAEGAHTPALSAWRNMLAITDIRSRRSTPFRELPPEPNPLLGLRASPSGAHLLLLIKGAPAELWKVDTDKPMRLRLLDLPFTAVEWVQPADVLTIHMTCVDDVSEWHQRNRAGCGNTAAAAGWWAAGEPPPHSPPAGAEAARSRWQGSEGIVGGAAPHLPAVATAAWGGSGDGGGGGSSGGVVEERLAFTLGDGRAGVLAVCGRHVADARAKRPVSSSGQLMDAVATAIAAWGHTVVLGDSWGQLGVWDTLTGKTTTMPTGLGTVRRILVAPAPHPSLYSTPEPASPIRLRLACLFSGGQFGVYELDAGGHIRAGHASPLTCTRMGRVLDLAWMNLPWLGQYGFPPPRSASASNGNGSGCVLAVVTELGAIALLDVSQASDRRPSFCQRMARLNSLLACPLPLKPSPYPPPLPSTTAPGASKPGALGSSTDGSAAVHTPPPPSLRPSVCAVLAAPRPVGSALLLWRPWALLLRLLLQLGVSQECLLLCCCSRAAQGPGVGAGSMGLSHGPPQARQQQQQQLQQRQQQCWSQVQHQQRALEEEQRLQDQQWQPWAPLQLETAAQQADKQRLQAQQREWEHQQQAVAESAAEVQEVQQELLGLLPEAVHQALLHAIDPTLPAAAAAAAAPPPSLHCTARAHSHTHAAMSPVGSPTSALASKHGAAAGSHGGASRHGSGAYGPGGQGEVGLLSTSPQGAIAMRRAESAGGKAVNAASAAASKVGGPVFRRLSSNSGHSRPTDTKPHGRHQQGATGGWEAKQQLQGSFQGDLLGLIAHLGRSRAQGQLLHPEEWRAYVHTLAHHSMPLYPSTGALPSHPHPPPHRTSYSQHLSPYIPPQPQHTPPKTSRPHTVAAAAASPPPPPAAAAAYAASWPQGWDGEAVYGRGFRGGVLGISQRMAVAAKVAGDAAEARFWKHLPSTLQAVVALRDALEAAGSARAARHAAGSSSSSAGGGGGGSGGSGGTGSGTSPAVRRPSHGLAKLGLAGAEGESTSSRTHLHHSQPASQHHQSPDPGAHGGGASSSSSLHAAGGLPPPHTTPHLKPTPGGPHPVGAATLGAIGAGAAAERGEGSGEEGELLPPLRHPPSAGLLATAEDEGEEEEEEGHSKGQLQGEAPPSHHTPQHMQPQHLRRHQHTQQQQQQQQQQQSLPAQAAATVHRQQQGQQQQQQQPDSGPLRKAPRGLAVKLWDEDLTLAEAQEHTVWHEALSRAVFEEDEALQEKRMLEYVVLGDFQTAVAFLLASTPEKSARYYRDALVTTVLAAAANARPEASTQRLMGAPMQIKAAKVVSAHASSVGDTLLAVPLHCAAGLYAEAVGVLQEFGLWRYAAHLTAHALVGHERAEALHRWATHVLRAEGNMWGAVGILVAAGCLQEALLVFLEYGLPDCAAAFSAACQAAGLLSQPTPPRPTALTDMPAQFAAGVQGPVCTAGGATAPPPPLSASTHTHATASPSLQPQLTLRGPEPPCAALPTAPQPPSPHLPASPMSMPTDPLGPTGRRHPLQGWQLYSMLGAAGAGAFRGSGCGSEGESIDAVHVQQHFEAYVMGLLAHI